MSHIRGRRRIVGLHVCLVGRIGLMNFYLMFIWFLNFMHQWLNKAAAVMDGREDVSASQRGVAWEVGPVMFIIARLA